jgi:hypothetical protein
MSQSAPAALDIDIASLASSTSGAGKQSAMVDNSVTLYKKIYLYVLIKLGTSPGANTGAYLHALRGDKHATPYRTDGASAAKGSLTVLNAAELGALRVKTSPATGDLLYLEATLVNPGPEWGVALWQDTTAPLDATAGNHFIHWVGDTE